MKLNILSHCVGRKRVLGAGKVLQNTLKGLTEIGVEISINEPISANEYNWIHDAPEGIIEAGLAARPVLVGPNTATMPTDLPRFRRLLHPSSIYLFPSSWPMKAWAAMGFNECRMESWAAGIDLHRFPPRKRSQSDPDRVLIYFKHRNMELLKRVTAMVQGRGCTYEIFQYGSYEEVEYQASLERAKGAIWIAGTESQGFALMEAMASGLPILVLDAGSLADNVHDPRDPLVPRFSSQFIASGATTAPYFDQRCGLKVGATDLDASMLNQFLDDVEAFDPASYVRSEFSLAQAARRLVGFAEQLPSADVRLSTRQSGVAKGLRYLDLVARIWAWKLAWHKLLKRIR